MTELFLVRHGETDSTYWGYPDKTPVIYGGHDVPLHENGEKEAQRAAVFLEKKHIDVLISSPLSRSVFGAEKIQTGRDLRIILEDDFREINRGKWTGNSPEDILKKFNGKLKNLMIWDYCAHEGESLGKFHERIGVGLKKVLKEHEGKKICIVSHKYVTTSIISHVLTPGEKKLVKINIPTASITHLTSSENNWKLEYTETVQEEKSKPFFKRNLDKMIGLGLIAGFLGYRILHSQKL